MNFKNLYRIALVWVVLAYSASAMAQNLVDNPGAETQVFGTLFGWIEVRGSTWVRGSEVPPNGGSYHFFAGNTHENDTSELMQVVDVSAYGGTIDAGLQAFNTGAYTRSWSDIGFDLDESILRIKFQNAGGVTLDSWSTGEVTSLGTGASDGDRNNALDGWVLREDTRIAPVGTRQIRIELVSVRNHSNDVDGYFDDVFVIPVCKGGTLVSGPTAICNGDVINMSLFSYSGSLQWQVSENGGAWQNLSGGAGSESYSPLASGSPHIYRVEVTDGACVEYSDSITVNVDHADAGALVLDQSLICQGDSVLLTADSLSGTLAWEYHDGGGWTSFGGNTAQETVMPTYAQSPTQYRAIATDGLCSDTTNEETVLIDLAIIGSTSLLNPAICEGDSFQIENVSSMGVLSWEANYAGLGWNSIGTGLSTEFDAPIVAQNPVLYRAIVAGPVCRDTSAEFVGTVNPAAVAGSISPTNSVICDGDSVQLSHIGSTGTLSWEWRANAGPWVNMPSAGSQNWVSPTAVETAADYRVVAQNGSCYDTTSLAQITINPTPSSGTLSSSLTTMCEGDSTLLSVSGESGNITLESNLAGAGWNATALILPVYQALSVFESTASYRVVAELSGCYDTSAIVNVDIVPNALADGLAVDQNFICEGEVINLSLLSTFGTLAWERRVNGGGWTSFGAANPNETDAPVIAESPVEYKSYAVNGICSDTSNIVMVTTGNSTATGTMGGLPGSICEGDSVLLSLTGESGNVQWQVLPNGGSWTSLPTGDSINVAPAASQSPLTYRAIVSSGSCGDTTSPSSVVNVVPSPFAGTLSAPSSDVCDGSDMTLSISGNTESAQWFEMAGAWSTTGSGSNTLQLTSLSSGDPTMYRVVVDNGQCADTSNVVSFTIHSPDAGVLTGDQTLCVGQDAVLFTSGHNGTLSWEKNYNYGGWQAIASANDTISDLPSVAQVPAQYRVVATENTCTDTSAIATATIGIVSAGTISSNSVTVCEGNELTLNSAGSSGLIQWEKRINAGVWSLLTVGSPSHSDYPLAIESPVEYRAVAGSGSCGDTSASIQVTISPGAAGGVLTSTLDSLCEGQSSTLTLTGQTGSLQWQRSISGGAWSDFGGPASSEMVSPLESESPVLYRVIASQATCSDTSTESLIVVQSTPNQAPTIVGATQSCMGNNEIISVVAIPGIDQYTWTVTNASFTTNIDGSQIDISGLSSGKVFLEVGASNNCGVSSSTTTHEVEFFEQPIASVDPGSAVLCDGDNVIISGIESSGATGINYAWLMDDNSMVGETSLSIDVQNQGNYSFVAYNQACSDTSSQAAVQSESLTFSAGNDLVVSPGSTVILEAVGDPSYTYSWSGAATFNDVGLLNPEVTTSSDAVLSLTAQTLNGCSSTDFVAITVLTELTIPNVFSPNGDGINDTWHIDQLDRYPDAMLQVYNRWGSLLYVTYEGIPWDGTRGGTELPVGTYYYVLTLGGDGNPSHGFVEIIK